MKSSCQQFEVNHGVGPISKKPFVRFTDGDYERLVLVPEARKIADEIIRACDAAEGVR